MVSLEGGSHNLLPHEVTDLLRASEKPPLPTLPKGRHRASKVAWWVKMLATKIIDQKFDLWAKMVEGED